MLTIKHTAPINSGGIQLYTSSSFDGIGGIRMVKATQKRMISNTLKAIDFI